MAASMNLFFALSKPGNLCILEWTEESPRLSIETEPAPSSVEGGSCRSAPSRSGSRRRVLRTLVQKQRDESIDAALIVDREPLTVGPRREDDGIRRVVSRNADHHREDAGVGLRERLQAVL